MADSLGRLIFDTLKLVAEVGLLIVVWVQKWQETHPPKPEEMIETEGEIRYVYYKANGLRPRSQHRAVISVRYINAQGKKVNATLPTSPLRYQIEEYAPELNQNMKVRILYSPKRPHSFYFAEPRYAVPEVSGVPRKPRGGWILLGAVTLLLVALLIFGAFFQYLEWKEYFQ